MARELGIDVAIGEVLPEHKAHHVKELEQKGRRVAMAGDGILMLHECGTRKVK